MRQATLVPSMPALQTSWHSMAAGGMAKWPGRIRQQALLYSTRAQEMESKQRPQDQPTGRENKKCEALSSLEEAPRDGNKIWPGEMRPTSVDTMKYACSKLWGSVSTRASSSQRAARSACCMMEAPSSATESCLCSTNLMQSHNLPRDGDKNTEQRGFKHEPGNVSLIIRATFWNILEWILPFEEAQVQYVYDWKVASSVVTVIPVPFHTEQLNRSSRQEEGQSQACPLCLLIPKVKAYTVDHWDMHINYTEGSVKIRHRIFCQTGTLVIQPCSTWVQQSPFNCNFKRISCKQPFQNEHRHLQSTFGHSCQVLL